MRPRKVYYMGLERLVARYTLQLTEWNHKVFESFGIPFIPVGGQLLDDSQQVVTGSVLDAHGRSYFSLTQTAELIRLMRAGEITNQDVVFFEDMFTPGAEALLYVLDQVPDTYRPRVYMRCLAQSIDPDDFVNREGMHQWMRRYEQVAEQLIIKSKGALLVASEEMVAHLRIASFTCPIYVVGLPFGKDEVINRYVAHTGHTVVGWFDRPKHVVFAARWDDEKQPLFYMEVARRVRREYPNIQFHVLSGHKTPKSNNPLLLRSDVLNSEDVTFHWGLSKNEYYERLGNARLLFNCALQDWVSNTVSEASALGTMQLYPAYRSFPEVFDNDHQFMYIPWSVDHAVERVIDIVQRENVPIASIGRVANRQNQSIDKAIQVMCGTGQWMARNNDSYRLFVAGPDYAAV